MILQNFLDKLLKKSIRLIFSETTVTNIEDLEEVPTMRATSNIHPAPIRRERRDTDRRSLRRKSEGDKNEKAKEGTIVKVRG